MRSDIASTSRRRMKTLATERERKKRFRGLKRKSKKLAARIKKVVISSPKFVYRCVCDHPFLASMVLFLLLLHAFVPSLFWFLVSNSPILICTALLLGTLLSFGHPHIPKIEEEEMKTGHDVALLQVPVAATDVVLQKEEAESSTDSDTDTELEDGIVASSLDVGERSEKVASREIGVEVMEIRGRGFRTGKDVFADILARRQMPEVTENSSADALEHVSCDLLKLREDDDLDLVHEDSEPGTCYYTLLRPADENDDHSDLGSDRSESASPDASMSDINPMLDELCPFIPTNHADDSVLGNFAPPLDVKIDNSDSESLVSTQPHGSGYGSDELEENIEETQEDDFGGDGVVWTADDEKNVMDLGSSEIERNRRLENLMAKRRERQNLNSGRLLDSRNVDAEKSSELPVQLPSISTRWSNPFADDSEDIGGLPPVPGSAPSILLQKSNPFDFPDKYFIQSDQYLEGFTLGASGSDSGEKHEFGMPQYFIPQERTYNKYQRQFSELGYPKLRSGFKPEPLYPLPDQEYQSGLLEQNSHDESEFILFTKHDDALLKDEDFAAPGASSLPIDVDTWNGMVNEPGSHTHFDALGAHNVPDVIPLTEIVSTDGVQYESFTTLETNLDNSGITVERIFSFGSDEKPDSPGPRSDETIESDSSTECDGSPMSEDPSDGKIPASPPSIDEPVILPVELSILPEIAEKIKAASELEQQLQVTEEPREISSDASEDSDAVVEESAGTIILGGAKEVIDEHILAELDVVGNFSVEHFPGNDNQAGEGSQSDSKFQRVDCKNLNLTESVACRVDHEAKLEVVGSSSEEDKEVEAQSGRKDAVSELHVIEASCLDGLDFALMRAEGFVVDSIGDAQSEQVDHQSDFHEIKVRSLDELHEVLGKKESDRPEKPTSISSDVHEAESLGLHEIIVGSLDELHAAPSNQTSPRKSTSIPPEEHDVESSDLHESIVALASLDDLTKKDTPQKPLPISSEEHRVESSDMHEIEVQSHDELHSLLGKQVAPPDLVDTLVEKHIIEDQHIQKNLPLTRCEEPGDSSRVAPMLHEIGARSFKELHAAMFNPDISSGSLDVVDSIDEAEAQLDAHTDPEKVSFDSQERGELQDTEERIVSDLRSLEDLHPILTKTDMNPETEETSSSRPDIQELHEIEVGTLEDLHAVLKKQDIDPKLAAETSDVPTAEAWSDAKLASEQKNTRADDSSSHSESHQVETQSSLDAQAGIVHSDFGTVDGTSLPSSNEVGDSGSDSTESSVLREAERKPLEDLHYECITLDLHKEAQSVQDLYEAIGQSQKPRVIVNSAPALLVEDMDSKVLSFEDADAIGQRRRSRGIECEPGMEAPTAEDISSAVALLMKHTDPKVVASFEDKEGNGHVEAKPELPKPVQELEGDVSDVAMVTLGEEPKKDESI